MHRLIVILIILFIGCSPEKEGTIYIQSSGLQAGELVLEKVIVRNIETVDTLKVVNDQAFFDYKVLETGVYRIRNQALRSAFLILDSNAHTTLEVNLDSNLSVSTSEMTYPMVNELNQMLYQQIQVELEIKDQYEIAKQNHESESVYQSFNQRYELSKINFKRDLEKLIATDSSSYSSLLLISWFSFFDDFELYQSVFKNLEAKYHTNAYYSELRQAFESKTTWMNQAFIDVNLPSLTGETSPLKDLKTKFILVEFWNTMCLPYVQGIHEHKKIIDRYEKEDLIVYSINLDEDPELWKNTVKNLGLAFKHVNDDRGFNTSPIIQQLELSKIPANFLLNSEFKVIAQNKLGKKLEDELIENLNY